MKREATHGHISKIYIDSSIHNPMLLPVILAFLVFTPGLILLNAWGVDAGQDLVCATACDNILVQYDTAIADTPRNHSVSVTSDPAEPTFLPPSPLPGKSYDDTNLPPRIGGNYTLSGTDVWKITKNSSFIGNITLNDNSTLVISNGKITIDGALWARDQSVLTITDANVIFRIPAVGPMPKELEYTKPNGFLLFEEGSRADFLRSRIWLYRHDFYVPPGSHRPFQIFSSFGRMSLLGCNFSTLGEVEISNSSMQPISRSGVFHGNSEFRIENTTMTGFVGYVNAHGWIYNSIIEIITLNELAGGRNVVVWNSYIGDFYTGWTSGAEVHATRIGRSITVNNYSQIFIMDGSTITGGTPETHIEGYGRMEIINSTVFDNLYLRTNGTLILDRALIKQGGDCVAEGSGRLIIRNQSKLARVFLHEGTVSDLNDSSIESLYADGNSLVRVWNMSIAKTPDLSICVGGQATIYNKTYRVDVYTSVNNLTLPMHVEVSDSMGSLKLSEFTSRPVTVGAWHEKYTHGNCEKIQYLIADVHRGGLSKRSVIDLSGDSPVITKFVKLLDSNPPDVKSVDYREIQLDGATSLIISARISDIGIGVENAQLFYSTDGGTIWTGIPMYMIGNITYETMMPQFSVGTGLLLKVSATDFCSNTANYTEHSYNVRSPALDFEIAALVSGLIMAVGVSTIAVISLRNRKK